MPYSDFPPPAVYPDTYDGVMQRDREFREGLVAGHALCSEFRQDQDNYSHHIPGVYGVWCANREPMGDRAHNWCWRCPAGYRIWQDPNDNIDPYSKDTRERATVLSW